MLAAVAALAGAFVAATLCISVTPLRELTQELAACPTADRVQRDVQPGGDVAGPAPGGGTVARPTETFELVCTYDDGTAKGVGNDRAVLGGIGVSVLAGLLLGGLPVLASGFLARRRRAAPTGA